MWIFFLNSQDSSECEKSKRSCLVLCVHIYWFFCTKQRVPLGTPLYPGNTIIGWFVRRVHRESTDSLSAYSSQCCVKNIDWFWWAKSSGYLSSQDSCWARYLLFPIAQAPRASTVWHKQRVKGTEARMALSLHWVLFADTKEVCCTGDAIFILERKSWVMVSCSHFLWNR